MPLLEAEINNEEKAIQQSAHFLKIVSKIELIIKNPLSEEENHELIPELSNSLTLYGIDFDPEKIKRLLPIDVERLRDLLKILADEHKVNSE